MIQSFESITANLASQEDFEMLQIIQDELSVSGARVRDVFYQQMVMLYGITVLLDIFPNLGGLQELEPLNGLHSVFEH